MIHVMVFVPENPLASSVTGFLDTLAIANQFLAYQGVDEALFFDWQLVSLEGGPQVSSQGVSFETQKLNQIIKPLDCLYFAAQHYQNDKKLLATLNKNKQNDLLNELCNYAKYVGAQCTGVSLLASTGQLDGHIATTSWWLNRFMKAHFLEVDVQVNRLLCQSSKFITSAATNSSLLVALTIIENIFSYEFAARVARCMTVDYQQNSQGRFMHSSEMISQPDRVVDKAKLLVTQQKNPVFTVKLLADECAVTERTLNRRFKHSLGLSPKQYINLVRIEKACWLLVHTDLSIIEISSQLQFVDESALRKAFVKQQGQSMNHYRQFSYKHRKSG
ncbi:helix-turn-helix domain-containing protein [Pseudoalteromonas sp. N1230-9]|uniref:GlxA family transcriptional regulator n=1 Tax=Pseudoalteromonas sp. N1230-9 TaxID=2907156 RepID=UPI002B291A15|nr:helix-turn-helix domain-containing protein [Pseudoalteromonas sp. N1230-9]